MSLFFNRLLVGKILGGGGGAPCSYGHNCLKILFETGPRRAVGEREAVLKISVNISVSVHMPTVNPVPS